MSRITLQPFQSAPAKNAEVIIGYLRQAIAELDKESLEGRLSRYAACARTLREGMEALGLRILVPAPFRSNLLTTFLLPEGVKYGPLHDAMKRRGYVIYAGQSNLRQIAFRIANLGTLTPEDMKLVVTAIRDSMHDLGVDQVTYG